MPSLTLSIVADDDWFRLLLTNFPREIETNTWGRSMRGRNLRVSDRVQLAPKPFVAFFRATRFHIIAPKFCDGERTTQK